MTPRRPPGLLTLGWISFAVLVAGCQPDDDAIEPGGALVAGAAAECPVLGPETIRIGDLDGAVVFTTVGSITPVPGTGDVLVLDPSVGEVRRFDRSGAPRGFLGRRGQGPGEFAPGPGLFMGSFGDSIWVQDPTLRRTSLFSPDGTLLRTITVPPGTQAEGFFTVSGGVPVAPNRLHAMLQWDGSVRPVPVVVLDGQGENPRTLAWLDPDDSPRAMLEVPGRGAITMVPPILFRSLVAVTRDEPRLVLIEASRGHATYRVRWLDPADGNEVSRYEAACEPVPVRAEERARQVSLIVERLSRMAILSPGQVEEAFNFPEIYPPFDRALPGPGETVWAQQAGPPGAVRWQRLDRDGPSRCTIDVAPAERVMFVGADGVWLRRTGELGVQSVIYRPWGSLTPRRAPLPDGGR